VSDWPDGLITNHCTKVYDAPSYDTNESFLLFTSGHILHRGHDGMVRSRKLPRCASDETHL
jgi:hypothetical protein